MIRRHLLIALPSLALFSVGRAMSPGVPFIVFFTDESSLLQPAALEVVRSASADAMLHAEARVHVLAFAELEHGVALSRELSANRAQQVVDALVASGVARSRILTGTRGAVPPELTMVEERRVEIRIGE